MNKLVLLLLIILACAACGEKDDTTVEEDPFLNDSGEFTDARDNHVYKWVRIGDQIWMAENLAYLPALSDIQNYATDEEHYFVYDYIGSDVDEAKKTDNYKTYGVLYSWYAALASCPEGWHVPSVEEWEQLGEFISEQNGGYEKTGNYWVSIGNHLKTTTGWIEDGEGTNDYGFSGQPGGNHRTVAFDELNEVGTWWTSSDTGIRDAYFRRLAFYYDALISGDYHKGASFSVRCIKD